MLSYTVNRLLQTLVTILFLTLIIFLLARLTGDPTPLIIPSEATDADRDFFRNQYGLDRSLPMQYLIFLGNVAQGDFGVSFRYREPAIDFVLRAFLPTLELTVAAMAIAIAIGLPLGILAGVHGGWIDRLVTLYAGMGIAVPSFWLGLMLIILFAIKIPILPTSGYGTLAHYVLPAATLGIFAAATIARLARANVQEALRNDFINLERILGLSERRIVWKHALRNASLPIITYLGLLFGALLGGAIVTERVFAWPGIGQTVVSAILQRDYPIVQATVLVTAVLFLLINLAVDLICMMLDPRVRT